MGRGVSEKTSLKERDLSWTLKAGRSLGRREGAF